LAATRAVAPYVVSEARDNYDDAMELDGVTGAFSRVLSDRLVALVAYGSVVTGDRLPGSDLDLLVVLRTPLTLDDAVSLQRWMPEPPGVSYIGVTYLLANEPAPWLVPDGFRLLTGLLEDGFISDEATLTLRGREVLRDLPRIVDQDARDWSGAIGEKRGRQVRLLTTRLKPAVRAMLAREGEPPLEVWRLPWDELVQRWRRHDPLKADALASVLDHLRAVPRDDQASGEGLLRLLEQLA
jgi:Nucleotidyltransferase domain